MTTIVKIKEGQTVPEGSKFLYTEEVRGNYLYTKERLVKEGFIFNTYQNVHVYETVRYFYYEVPTKLHET